MRSGFKLTVQTPRLYRVILPVPDIDRAAAFYSAALAIPGERVSPGRHYFQCGGTIDQRIETLPWGERMYYARDPFGSRIRFFDERALFTG